MNRWMLVTAVLLLPFSGLPLHAADRFDTAHGASPIVNGVLSVWGQAVVPTNGVDDSVACDPGVTAEFCNTVPGWGVYAGGQTSFHEEWALIGDFTFDSHHETTQNSALGNDDPGSYFGLGGHLVHRGHNVDLGVFGMGAWGQGHAGAAWVDPVIGGGVEVRRGHWFVQGGLLHHAWQRDGDGLEYLAFARLGAEHALGTGTLAGSVAGGFADFNNLSAVEATGEWFQLTLDYQAPIPGTHVNWYIGYQGDWLQNEAAGGEHRVFFHALKVGATLPIAHGEGPSSGPWAPFSTPNFRAPVSNSSELAK